VFLSKKARLRKEKKNQGDRSNAKVLTRRFHAELVIKHREDRRAQKLARANGLEDHHGRKKERLVMRIRGGEVRVPMIEAKAATTSEALAQSEDLELEEKEADDFHDGKEG